LSLDENNGYTVYFPEDIREDVLFWGFIAPQHLWIIIPSLFAGALALAMPLPGGIRLVLTIGIPLAGVLVATLDIPRQIRRIRRYRASPLTLVAGENLEPFLLPVRRVEEPYLIFNDGSAAVVLKVDPPPWESQMLHSRLHANEVLRSALRTAAEAGAEVTIYVDVEPDLQIPEWMRQAERLRTRPHGLRQLGEARLRHHIALALRREARRVAYYVRLHLHRPHVRRRHRSKVNPLIESLSEITSWIIGEFERAGHRVYALSSAAVGELVHRQLHPWDWEAQEMEKLTAALNLPHAHDVGKTAGHRHWWVGARLVVIGSQHPELSSATAAALAQALVRRGLPTVLVDADRRARGAAAARPQSGGITERARHRVKDLVDRFTGRRSVEVKHAPSDLLRHVNDAVQRAGRKGWVVVNLSSDRVPDEDESALLNGSKEIWMALYAGENSPDTELRGKGRLIVWPRNGSDPDPADLPAGDLETGVVATTKQGFELPTAIVEDLIYTEVDDEDTWLQSLVG